MESVRTSWPYGMCILVAEWRGQASCKRKSPWQSQSSKGCLLHRYRQPDISVGDAGRWKHCFRHPSQCFSLSSSPHFSFSATPDWNSGINTSERYSSDTWSPSKARPRLVIPNWLNKAACNRHMEAAEHLKKMRNGNVLIRCIHTHTPCFFLYWLA